MILQVMLPLMNFFFQVPYNLNILMKKISQIYKLLTLKILTLKILSCIAILYHVFAIREMVNIKMLEAMNVQEF